jgi:phage N-6-adenine-methyltransferase
MGELKTVALPAVVKTIATSQAKIDTIIDYARRVKDWPLLEEAVDAKVDEQGQFVAWWDETITKNRGGDRTEKSNVSDSDTLLTADAVEKTTGISRLQVSRWRKALATPDAYRDALFNAAYRKAMGLKGQSDLRGASGTGENEWYTPALYLTAAREVLGEIDLDPASSEHAQKTVQAKRIFTAQDDGLSQEWHGKIWLNPPYAQPLMSQFITKLMTELTVGHAQEAILLTHNYTDTGWFHEAAGQAHMICFTRGRVRFVDAEGTEAAPTQGQAFFYFGPQSEEFRLVFREFGFVAIPCQGKNNG